eukprot:3934348-Rhodomonas_salina.1
MIRSSTSFPPSSLVRARAALLVPDAVHCLACLVLACERAPVSTQCHTTPRTASGSCSLCCECEPDRQEE